MRKESGVLNFSANRFALEKNSHDRIPEHLQNLQQPLDGA
jgi:hypothetical protein